MTRRENLKCLLPAKTSGKIGTALDVSPKPGAPSRRLWADASQFERTDSVIGETPSRCRWNDCRIPQFKALPVCYYHAAMIHRFIEDILDVELDAEPKPKPDAFVYYLMIAPSTVKIGTTTNLRSRINSLRTDLQYVVAIERGGMKLERRRHKEFADERIGRRENFQLSDRLKTHIEAMQPNRDELVDAAVSSRAESNA